MHLVIKASEARPGDVLDFEPFEDAVRPYRWRVVSVTPGARVHVEMQSMRVGDPARRWSVDVDADCTWYRVVG